MTTVIGKDTEAEFDNNVGQYSCTVTIGETFLFFGGYTVLYQISQLTPRGLRRMGSLPFKLTNGLCVVKSPEIFLGFGETSQNRCWSRLCNISNNPCSIL